MGWKREILDEDLWSLTLPNRWDCLTDYHMKRIDRCRGVVPLWDKKWSKSAKDKKAAKKPISILPTLARCSNSQVKRFYKNSGNSDASGLTSSGRPFWLPYPLFFNLHLRSLSSNWLGAFHWQLFLLFKISVLDLLSHRSRCGKVTSTQRWSSSPLLPQPWSTTSMLSNSGWLDCR